VLSARDGADSARPAAAADAPRAEAGWLQRTAEASAAFPPAAAALLSGGAAAASAASSCTPRKPARARRRIARRGERPRVAIGDVRTWRARPHTTTRAPRLLMRAARPSLPLRGAAAPTLRGPTPLAVTQRAAKAPLRPRLPARLAAMDAAVEAAEELHRQAAQLNKDGRFEGACAAAARWTAR
jgi:hypothetical protein